MGKSKEKSPKPAKNTEKAAEDSRRGDQKSLAKEMKSRATVKLHGVDNAETYEHPGSTAAATREMDPSSLKYFA